MNESTSVHHICPTALTMNSAPSNTPSCRMTNGVIKNDSQTLQTRFANEMSDDAHFSHHFTAQFFNTTTETAKSSIDDVCPAPSNTAHSNAPHNTIRTKNGIFNEHQMIPQFEDELVHREAAAPKLVLKGQSLVESLLSAHPTRSKVKVLRCSTMNGHQEQQSRSTCAKECYEELCKLLQTRLSCLSTWRSGQTLRIHDTGKCIFTTGKSGLDIEICIHDDNNGIVISSIVFRTDHDGAGDADEDITTSSAGGVKDEKDNTRVARMQKVSYSLMTIMLKHNILMNKQSCRGHGQVILYNGRFVLYLHASLSILQKSRYIDLVDVLDKFHMKALEISKDFESASVKAHRRQLHLLRFR